MAKGSGSQRPGTRLVTAGRRAEWTGAAVNPPVWRTSTHLYEDSADLAAGRPNADGHFYYGRRGTPTQWALAEALTEIEPGAAGTVLYPSGVAAIAGALLTVLKPGDVLLVTDNAYEPTRTLANGLLKRMGVETVLVDTGRAAVEALGPLRHSFMSPITMVGMARWRKLQVGGAQRDARVGQPAGHAQRVAQHRHHGKFLQSAQLALLGQLQAGHALRRADLQVDVVGQQAVVAAPAGQRYTQGGGSQRGTHQHAVTAPRQAAAEPAQGLVVQLAHGTGREPFHLQSGDARIGLVQ